MIAAALSGLDVFGAAIWLGGLAVGWKLFAGIEALLSKLDRRRTHEAE